MISTTDIAKFRALKKDIDKYEKYIPKILTSAQGELKFFIEPKYFIAMVLDFTKTYRHVQSWSIPHTMKGKLTKYSWPLIMNVCNELHDFISAFKTCIKKSGKKGDTVEAINKIIDANNLNKPYISYFE